MIEEREDENSDVANKLKAMHISPPETVEEESEVEVPVIVEGEIIDKPAEQGVADAQQPYQVKIDVQEDVAVEPDTVEEGEYAAGESAPPIFSYEKVDAPSEKTEESEPGSAESDESEKNPDAAAATSTTTTASEAAATTEDSPTPALEESTDAATETDTTATTAGEEEKEAEADEEEGEESEKKPTSTG